jgi:hypothetical protein
MQAWLEESHLLQYNPIKNLCFGHGWVDNHTDFHQYFKHFQVSMRFQIFKHIEELSFYVHRIFTIEYFKIELNIISK